MTLRLLDVMVQVHNFCVVILAKARIHMPQRILDTGLCRYDILSILLLCLCLSTANAAAPYTAAKHAIVMDAATGTILFSKDADATMYPASMTKMMTAYMMFESLRSGELSLKGTYRVSENAWRKGGSKMFVQLGSDIAIEDLMRGIIIQSGNDACIVFAEGFAGSEARFAERMTEKARSIGMANTTFKNATGWPDEAHVTTARDLVTLADRIIRDFPEYYRVYSERSFTYHDITQHNRNLLLGRNIGVDGLKTGHTEAAGYGITVSGEQQGRRVHVVVGGLDSEKARATAAQELYLHGIHDFASKAPHGTLLGSVPVWFGVKDSVAVTAAPEAALVLPVSSDTTLTMTLITDRTLRAPIRKGEPIGTLQVSAEGMSEQSIQIVSAEDVAEAGIVKRLITNIRALINR